MEQIIEEYGIGGIYCDWYRGPGRAWESSAIDCGGIEYGSSGKRIRQCGTGCGGRSCVFLATLGQFLLSRQGLIMQMIEVWGNGGC